MANVLIADDQPVALKLGQKILEKDYQVILASDGREAMRLLRARRVDVVVLDVQMPFISGLDVARMVLESWPNTPVILVSAHFTDRGLSPALGPVPAGVFACLPKPVSPRRLLQVVQEAAEKSAENSTKRIGIILP